MYHLKLYKFDNFMIYVYLNHIFWYSRSWKCTSLLFWILPATNKNRKLSPEQSTISVALYEVSFSIISVVILNKFFPTWNIVSACRKQIHNKTAKETICTDNFIDIFSCRFYSFFSRNAHIYIGQLTYTLVINHRISLVF